MARNFHLSSNLRDFCYPIMPARIPVLSSDWSYTSADTTDTSTTIEQCPSCRAAQPDIVAARVRIAAVVLFARQLRLEVAELASLLAVPLPDEGF